ncbi:hypothetical protein DS832_07465 [Bombilactobacillus bombi]|uniref:Beta-xylosidase C-terminal Concanavalin A-like domain-containing protein n=1 Tax=Bombilactobacillus bombi TaxID=1303590 RepID=A0A3R6V635_9LACO|nr:hypothetical protein DS832_07465 [Bombilactobacillus bombi]
MDGMELIRHSFFDDDGKVYIQGNAYKSNEQLGIYQAQINIDTGNLITQRELICKGSGGKSPESPHIFKKDKFYYLTVAEGGNEYGHMVTIFRSNNISGPYESYINNPILTNRSTSSKVQCVGHADIFEDYEHNWWTVCLGIRVSGHHAYYHHLGRETFLSPIEWNDDNWPCINKNGHIDLKMFGKLKNPQKNISNDLFMDFTKDKNISQRLVYLRNPNDDDYKLVKNKGLILNGSKKTLNDTGKVTFLGLRQSEFNVKYQAQFEFSELNNKLIFGISTFMFKDYHFDLSVNLSLKMIYLKIKLGNIDTLLYKIPLNSNNHIILEIDADHKYYYYYVYQNNIKTISKL